MAQAMMLISLLASAFCFAAGLVGDDERFTTLGFYLILFSIWWELIGIGLTI